MLKTDYVDDFITTVRTASARLARVADDDAAKRPASDKWSAKEIIGHLIDSASNSHQRFVRATWQDDLVFPGYAQEAWVIAQQYQTAPWRQLVTLWTAFNYHLARVMRATPDAVRLRLHTRHNLDQWQLAQVNVGRARGEVTDPVMGDFVALLAEINALADQSPGFVWRLQTEDGDATAVRPVEDARVLINLSVWADLPPLRRYVYESAHAAVMRRRREWFERFDGLYVALWWVAAGHQPTAAEAIARLAHLQQRGPTPFAFDFIQPFGPDGLAIARDGQVPVRAMK